MLEFITLIDMTINIKYIENDVQKIMDMLTGKINTTKTKLTNKSNKNV